MGRRSRKRSGEGQVPEGAAASGGRTAPAPRRESRRAHLDEAPKPPWAPVPLTEICILGGALLMVVGLVGGGASRALLLGFGFALVFLATIEMALREHLAGYRSHSALIAGCAAAVALGAAALLAGLPRVALAVVAAVVFGAVFLVMRSIFKSRAGGMSWRA